MRKHFSLIVILLSGFISVHAQSSFYDFTVTDINGDEFPLAQLQGKKVLVVNTASECGLTPQYAGLERLYKKYGGEDFVILGFPSNDFGAQEPGTEKQVQEFCRLTYAVDFPMFEKTTVKGDEAHPFFVSLAEASGTYPTWNFHKFLIGRDGQLIAEFSPRTKPYDDQVVAAIESALAN